MKKKNKNKTLNWTYYLAELLVVFVGVSAGFLLNSWREDQANLKLEHQYLASFYRDVVADQAELDSLIIRGNRKSDTLIEILKKSELIDVSLTEEMAGTIAHEITSYEWFTGANDTYEDIINSGNLNLISDYKLKEQISSYYSLLAEVKNVEQFYREHLNNYGFPILYKNYHLFKQKFVNKESYQSLEFINMYLGITSFIQQNNAMYKRALAKNQEFKELLAKTIIR